MALVTVAVGILIDDAGRVLVTRRAPAHTRAVCGNFPAVRSKQGETLLDALARELKEELGVLVETRDALMVLDHDYGDKQVRLDVHRVTRWSGEPEVSRASRWLGSHPSNSKTGRFPLPTAHFGSDYSLISGASRAPVGSRARPPRVV